MRIEHTTENKTVDVYEIISVQGLTVPLVIDTAIGDSIDIGPEMIKVYTAPRETSDPDTKLPAEDAIIYSQHVFMINHRRREIQALNPEQREQFRKLLRTLAKPETVPQ